MKLFLLIPYYIAWHYTSAIKGIFHVWNNLMWFIRDFFSIEILFKTLFSPFQRISSGYKGGVAIEDFFSSLFANTLMRIIGFILRTVTILIGLIVLIIVFILGFVFFILWLILPFLLAYILVLSIIALINFGQ